MVRIGYLFILLLFSSCTTGVSLIENDFSSLLHDGNSKVWMIKELESNGSDFAKKGEIRDLLIFYENGTCILQSTGEIATQTGQKANYKANFAQKTLSITFPKEKWDFIVEIKSEDEILLKPIQGSKTNFSLTLVPLPELVTNNKQ
jgi:hypothetical protein